MHPAINLEKGAVYYDVGANVSMYVILAAAISEAQVFAFEPEARNYFALNQNIQINKLWNRVVAYPVGLSDFDGPHRTLLIAESV